MEIVCKSVRIICGVSRDVYLIGGRLGNRIRINRGGTPNSGRGIKMIFI